MFKAKYFAGLSPLDAQVGVSSSIAESASVLRATTAR